MKSVPTPTNERLGLGLRYNPSTSRSWNVKADHLTAAVAHASGCLLPVDHIVPLHRANTDCNQRQQLVICAKRFNVGDLLGADLARGSISMENRSSNTDISPNPFAADDKQSSSGCCKSRHVAHLVQNLCENTWLLQCEMHAYSRCGR